ncbi:hypothetical protein SynA1840_01490 [Synechococcus sp. A18-40]|nr:hypothetical protein SynA1840_01490 [Synechococcus sp. A18-40]
MLCKKISTVTDQVNDKNAKQPILTGEDRRYDQLGPDKWT